MNKNTAGHNDLFALYPIAFGIRDYTYFLTYEELDEIPIVNVQPTFNPETEQLVLIETEENEQLVRRWVVDVLPPVE